MNEVAMNMAGSSAVGVHNQKMENIPDWKIVEKTEKNNKKMHFNFDAQKNLGVDLINILWP